MKILFIGGTGFVGRHMVQHAIDAGHQITLFNRNQTDASVFSEVERLVGDRTKSLDLLQGRSWDAVVDINGYLPDVVSASLSQLQNSVGRYVFISTGSVYAINNQIRLDEHAPLLSTANLNPADYAGAAYGEGPGDSDLNSTFHLTIPQLKSMTKNQLAKQGVFYATYRKKLLIGDSALC